MNKQKVIFPKGENYYLAIEGTTHFKTLAEAQKGRLKSKIVICKVMIELGDYCDVITRTIVR